jgi:hypothetical protein
MDKSLEYFTIGANCHEHFSLNRAANHNVKMQDAGGLGAKKCLRNQQRVVCFIATMVALRFQDIDETDEVQEEDVATASAANIAFRYRTITYIF